VRNLNARAKAEICQEKPARHFAPRVRCANRVKKDSAQLALRQPAQLRLQINHDFGAFAFRARRTQDDMRAAFF
jgi:hypothetical protein